MFAQADHFFPHIFHEALPPSNAAADLFVEETGALKGAPHDRDDNNIVE